MKFQYLVLLFFISISSWGYTPPKSNYEIWQELSYEEKQKELNKTEISYQRYLNEKPKSDDDYYLRKLKRLRDTSNAQLINDRWLVKNPVSDNPVLKSPGDDLLKTLFGAGMYSIFGGNPGEYIAAEYELEHGSPYDGICPCPYSRAKDGSRCGERSAYSRSGGQSPRCY